MEINYDEQKIVYITNGFMSILGDMWKDSLGNGSLSIQRVNKYMSKGYQVVMGGLECEGVL